MPPTQPNCSSVIRIHQFMFGPNLPEDGLRLEDRVEIISQQRGRFSYLLDPLSSLNDVPYTNQLFKPPVSNASTELSEEDIVLMDSLNSRSSKVMSGLKAFFS